MQNPRTPQHYTAVRNAVLVALASSLVSTAALAAEDDKAAERIIVTGSHIKRVDIEGTSPILTISRDDIEKGGYTTVSDLVRNLTINAGSLPETNTNSFANGTNQFNLRGLGVGATLTLINGRRVAPHGQAQNIVSTFVDINSIPMSAIERIDILKDGASAIYGADAVAGVVNIILRKEYEGAEVNIGHKNTVETDAADNTFSFVSGAVSDKGAWTVVGSYQKISAQTLSDRDFSASADSSFTPQGADLTSTFAAPGTYRNLLTGAWVSDPQCGLGASVGPNGGFCRYDFNNHINLSPETERAGLFVTGHREISDNITAFAEFMYNRKHDMNVSAPAPATFTAGGIWQRELTPAQLAVLDFSNIPFIAADHPNNPYGVDLQVRYRPIDAGDRRQELTTNATRAVVGLEFLIGDWDSQLSWNFTRSEVLVANRNSILQDRFQAALLGRGGPNGNLYYNPFGGAAHNGSNSRELIDWMSFIYDQFNDSFERGLTWSASNGNLFELPGGPVGVAVGVEYREQSYAAEADKQRNDGNLLGTGSSANTYGQRDQTSTYIEFSLPIVEGLEVQIAGRHEDYSDFGTKTLPKIGAKWNIGDDWLVRASWGESFRAPSLPELFNGATSSFPTLVDPIRCPVTGLASDCAAQIRVENGGNVSLMPEVSESTNFGVIWSPDAVDGLSMGIDVFQYDYEDIITQPSLNFILNNVPSLVFRAPATPADDALGIPGTIEYILNSYINGDSQTVKGADFNLRYRWETGAGTFTLTNDLTYLDQFDLELVTAPGQPIEGAGNNQIRSLPQYRNNLGLNWVNGDHQVYVVWHYVSDYDDDAAENAATPGPFVVDEWNTFDLQYAYSLPNIGAQIRVGCQNCTDEDPPFTNQKSTTFNANYDFTVHDARGAMVYLNYQQSF